MSRRINNPLAVLVPEKESAFVVWRRPTLFSKEHLDFRIQLYALDSCLVAKERRGRRLGFKVCLLARLREHPQLTGQQRGERGV